MLDPFHAMNSVMTPSIIKSDTIFVDILMLFNSFMLSIHESEVRFVAFAPDRGGLGQSTASLRATTDVLAPVF